MIARVSLASPFCARVQAAAENLVAWAEDGVIAPRADRIALAVKDVVSKAEEDEFGNAVGGVRSPFVDVPLLDYDVHSEPGAICQLIGNETPLPSAVLAEKYGSVDSYLTNFTASPKERPAATRIRI